MGRRRKAWLTNGTGRRKDRGHLLPGYYVEWREGAKHRSRCFARIKSAREFMVAMNRRLERLGVGNVVGIEMRSAIEEFLGEVVTLAVSTQIHLSGILGRFALFVGADTLVHEISPAAVSAYLQQQQANGLTESSCSSHLRYLKRFFRWCVSREYMPRDPVRLLAVRPVSIPRIMGSLPSDADIAKLLSVINDVRLRLATALALTTGLDRGVVATLTRGQIDFATGTITAVRPKTRRVGGAALTVPVHPALLPQLQLIADESGPDLPLFPDYFGRYWWHPIRKKAGPPWTDLRVADFRKIASGRFQRVAPLAQVQRMLGHSTIAVTASHYSPIDPSARRAFDELPLAWCEGTPPAT